MATVSNPYESNDDEDSTQGQGQNSVTGQGQTSQSDSAAPSSSPSSTDASASGTAPLQTAASSSQVMAAPSSGASGGGSTAAAATNPKGTSSGAYTNLQAYMNANQNFNASGGGLAGQLASSISSYAPNTTAAVNQFNSTVNPYQTAYGNAASAVSQAVADPVATLQNSNLASQVEAADTANYTGPQSLMDLTGQNNYSNLQSQASNYNSLVNEGQSETGRYDLLNQIYNNPNYSTGDQSLDNLLIESSPSQLQTLSNQRQSAANATNSLNNAQQYATMTGQGLTNQADAVRQSTSQALNNALGNVNSSVNSTLTADQAQNAAIQQALAASALTPSQQTYDTANGITAPSGTLTAAQAALLGISASDLNDLNGTNTTVNLPNGLNSTTGITSAGQTQNTGLNATLANLPNATSPYGLTAQQVVNQFNLPTGLQNNTGTYTPITLAQIQALQNQYAINPTSYFNPGNPTAATVATPQQQAQIAALSQLANVTNSMPDASEAGTYNPSNEFNSTAYNTALTSAQQNYMNGLAQLLDSSGALKPVFSGGGLNTGSEGNPY